MTNTYEIIIRQMMRKVEIVDPGDTRFLEKQVVDKNGLPALKTTGFTIKKWLLIRGMQKELKLVKLSLQEN
jgi:hypothetical protein